MFNFWWLAERSEQKMLTEMQKKWKRPPKSLKNKMFNFGLCSTSDDWLSNPSKKMMTKMQKNEKGPLSHRKIKCLFFNYINFWWSAEQSKQKTLTKTKKKTKKVPKSLKNKMFVFGLCSTSDDQLSNPEEITLTKIQKNEKGLLSHWKMKCSFLDYVHFLMIGQAIRVKNVDRNTKKTKKAP